MSYLAGIDIGGTKCAVTLGEREGDGIRILDKVRFLTPKGPENTIPMLISTLNDLLEKHPKDTLEAIGISCGGPLDSRKGIILCPPNLPGWIDIDIITPFEAAFHVPTAVQNDANACALAEWKWGAGKGKQNVIFLTFGTGMGAGLILDGRLYSGTSDMGGEVGHLRLEDDGPVGFGKAGSFEGFCSGGGIGRYAKSKVEAWTKEGKQTKILEIAGSLEEISAEVVGKAAQEGDELALSIWEDTGRRLGKGLSLLIDILNPEVIVIGSIFLRQEVLLRGPMEEVINKETILYSREVCQVLPAGLGESLGDYAALSVAEWSLTK